MRQRVPLLAAGVLIAVLRVDAAVIGAILPFGSLLNAFSGRKVNEILQMDVTRTNDGFRLRVTPR